MKPPVPAHQWRGARARSSGRELEAAVERVNAWYDVHGHALVERVHLPVEGWGKTLRVAGPATVDFTGHALLGGVRTPVVFDCKKVTDRASFAVDPGDWHQLQHLLNARNRHGARAFYLLYCDTLRTAWVCDDLDTLDKRKSVPIREKLRSGKVVHQLPYLEVGDLPLAALSDPATRRPRLDYLYLL